MPDNPNPTPTTTPATTTPTFKMTVSEPVATTPPVSATPPGMIRNLNQTVQEREIIKTSPDIIVYLDGKTYLLNPYITNSDKSQPYTYVSFNDYVHDFSASYDVDSLIPTGNFTLQVPNSMKYLFQAPGGNNLIESMMEVQVFAKGYFPSGNGNTVYYRVFKGMTSHVSHTDTGLFLEISVQVLGVMQLLEFMYTDLNVAVNSNSDLPLTAMTSNQSGMSPYKILANTLQRAISFTGFQLNALQQDSLKSSYWGQAVQAGYINKWQPILLNLIKEVHILGYYMDKTFPQNINGFTAPLIHGTMDPTLHASRIQQASPQSQVQQASPTTADNSTAASTSSDPAKPDYYVNVIKQYLPDMGIGSIQLVNGRITSRLERIRTIVQLIGYEAFQDIDGTVIFKPPLYNLDVTRIGTNVTPKDPTVPKSSVDITEATNPFVVHLSEIETESEAEDQQGIKATRMTVQPNWIASNQFIATADGRLRPAITHIDIPKLARFGLREEPARTVPWLNLQDKIACYTYAVSDLNRANRGWRTYNLSIPLRPELKLGFPMYLPHKDMYGYIKAITISYSQGAAATMNIMLDTLRKRPLFPSSAPAQNSSGGEVSGPQQEVVLYTTQPNLVMEWTTPPSGSSTGTTGNTGSTNTNASATAGTGTSMGTGANTGMGVVTNPTATPTQNHPAVLANGLPVDTQAVLINLPATQLQPSDKPVYQEELEIISQRRSQLGTSWGTKADTKNKCFRVQNDVATAADANFTGDVGDSADAAAVAAAQQTAKNITPGAPFFSSDNWGPNTDGINIQYLQKVLSSQPYTDEGGYELITPFPWGRWKSLKQAIFETHQGVIVNSTDTTSAAAPTSVETQTITTTDVFLFAGVGAPSDFTPSSNLQTQVNALNNVSTLAASATSFEIVTPKPGEKQQDILSAGQPDTLLYNNLQSTLQSNVNTFLTGNTPPQPNSASALVQAIKTTVTPNPSAAVVAAPLSQNDAFIKTVNSSNQTTTSGE